MSLSEYPRSRFHEDCERFLRARTTIKRKRLVGTVRNIFKFQYIVHSNFNVNFTPDTYRSLHRNYEVVWAGFLDSPLANENELKLIFIEITSAMIKFQTAKHDYTKVNSFFLSLIKLLIKALKKSHRNDNWITIWNAIFYPGSELLESTIVIIENVNVLDQKRILSKFNKIEEKLSRKIPDNYEEFLRIKALLVEKTGTFQESQNAYLDHFQFMKQLWKRNKTDFGIWESLCYSGIKVKKCQVLEWILQNWNNHENSVTKLQIQVLLCKDYTKGMRYREAMKVLMSAYAFVCKLIMTKSNKKMEDLKPYLDYTIDLLTILNVCSKNLNLSQAGDNSGLSQETEKAHSLEDAATNPRSACHIRLYCTCAALLLHGYTIRNMNEEYRKEQFLEEIENVARFAYGCEDIEKAEAATTLAFQINQGTYPERHLNNEKFDSYSSFNLFEESINLLELDLEHMRDPEKRAYHYAIMGKLHMFNRNFKGALENFIKTLDLWQEEKFTPQLQFNVPSYIREVIYHNGTYKTYQLGTEIQRAQWGLPDEECDHQLNFIKMARYDIIRNTSEDLRKARWSLSNSLGSFEVPAMVEEYNLGFTENLILYIPILDDRMERKKVIDILFNYFFTSLHMLESIHQVFQKYSTHDIHFDNFIRCLLTDENFVKGRDLQKTDLKMYRNSAMLTRCIRNTKRIL